MYAEDHFAVFTFGPDDSIAGFQGGKDAFILTCRGKLHAESYRGSYVVLALNKAHFVRWLHTTDHTVLPYGRVVASESFTSAEQDAA